MAKNPVLIGFRNAQNLLDKIRLMRAIYSDETRGDWFEADDMALQVAQELGDILEASIGDKEASANLFADSVRNIALNAGSKEQRETLLNRVHEDITSAAKNGKLSTKVIIPEQVSLEQVMQILASEGFRITEKELPNSKSIEYLIKW